MLECLGNKPTHFILIFDNGYFSEFGAFSISDWIGHAPKSLLAKNFGMPESTFDGFQRRKFILPVATFHRNRYLKIFKGGREWRIDSTRFLISTTVTGVIRDLQPGALRELHLHPNVDEWQYVIDGDLDVTMFGSHGRFRTETTARWRCRVYAAWI